MRTLIYQRFFKGCRLAVSLLFTVCLVTSGNAADVHVVDIDGGIGPAKAGFFLRSLEEANDRYADLLVIRMNTPGGLVDSMREIVSGILASNIPVVTFVTPNGARAASAGTYIAYASHVVAMSPATNIGSSTPVSIGGGDSLPIPGFGESEEGESEKSEESTAQPGSAMGAKIVNDSIAYIRGLAELRGRNADWAEESVRQASNIIAIEAVDLNVADLIASDLDDLLEKLDGREIKVNDDVVVKLDLRKPSITIAEKTWRDELLDKITDPNIAYILLMVGIYALIFEFYSPGVGVGAVVGVIMLLVAAYALHMLPVNYVGLLLLVLGIGLMATEAFVPSFGVFAIGGLVSFGFGSILLFDDDLGGFGVSLGLVLGVAITTGIMVVYTLSMAVRQRRKLSTTGTEALIGESAIVIADFQNKGKVRYGGEIWNATNGGTEKLISGSLVTIESVDKLKLTVKQGK